MFNYYFFKIKSENNRYHVIIKDQNQNVVVDSYDECDISQLVCPIFVGYQNYQYDDFMMLAMMNHATHEQLVALDRYLSFGSRVKEVPPFISFDASQQISKSKPDLELIAYNMGKPNVRSLSDEINVIMSVYFKRKAYFDAKLELILRMKTNKTYKIGCHRWTNGSMTAQYLNGDGSIPTLKDVTLPDDSLWKYVPRSVVSMWDLRIDDIREGVVRKYKTSLCTTEKYNKHVLKLSWGSGGLHAVDSSQRVFNNVYQIDIKSGYPTTAIKLNLLGDRATKLYKGIVDERLACLLSDTSKAQALKNIINIVYGNCRNHYSKMYNPMVAMTINIYLQIAIYTLYRQLYMKGCVVNINTDAVTISSDRDKAEITKTANAWAKTWGYDITITYYKTYIQKNVNEYIAVDQVDNLKVKGSDVGHYKQPSYYAMNTPRIVDIAMADMLTKQIPPRVTISKYINKPELFQWTVTSPTGSLGIVDDSGRKYDRVNRVVATYTSQECAVSLRQKLATGVALIPNIPDYVVVINNYDGSIRENKYLSGIIDTQVYIEIIRDKIKKWGVMI